VHSSFPLMRLDAQQPREWYHAYQRFYAFPAFSLLYASIQCTDFVNLVETCCYKVNFRGTGGSEIILAVGLRLLHYGWLFGLPCTLHGSAALLPACWALLLGSFWTALLFVVSHNLESCKPGYQLSDAAKKDWAIWQIETSASWGGEVASFFTGGLNLQVEHHLFPCLPHNTHAAIAPIVQEECAKAGVRYNGFPSLFSILQELWSFLKVMGEKDHDHLIKADSPEASSSKSAEHRIAAGAVNAARGVQNAAVGVAQEVANTAKEVANSAVEAQQKMGKEDEPALKILKPMLLAMLYQGAQEWYTSHWDQSLQSWEATSAIKPAIFSALYLATVWGGMKYMKNRQVDSRLRKYMLTYNLYQVILNGWCVYAFLQEIVLHHPHPFNLRIDQSSYKLTFLIWVHYNNKFIELLDTVFMVFNKKNQQVSFLHVYHHVLLMWSWWAVCRWGCGGIAWFSAFLNSFIHVLMYGYYFLAALKLDCPWKKKLTMMQMIQFCCCMSTALYALYHGLYPLYLSLLNIWVMLNMLVLFGNFYRQKYKKSESSVHHSTGQKLKAT